MTTGVPIYLVSACASGEEFVAAFRRYSDRGSLFVPMADPLPPGRRGRLALTLRDGGVMIEGDCEIVSSSKTASILHGRVGMTIRFVEPDADSKTLLGDLDRARISIRPSPTTVKPRAAEVPAAPRPVPPPPAGRIDAAIALAECVYIGDLATLREGSAPLKPGPKFVMPSIPGAGAKVPTIPPKFSTQPAEANPIPSTAPVVASRPFRLPTPPPATELVPTTADDEDDGEPAQIIDPLPRGMPSHATQPSAVVPPPPKLSRSERADQNHAIRGTKPASTRPTTLGIAAQTRTSPMPMPVVAPRPSTQDVVTEESTDVNDMSDVRSTAVGVGVPGAHDTSRMPVTSPISAKSMELAPVQLVAPDPAAKSLDDGDWTMAPDDPLPTLLAPATPTPAALPAGPMTGNWTIALTPEGWGEVEKVAASLPAPGPPTAVSGETTRSPGPPSSTLAGEKPIVSTERAEPVLMDEGKIQVDPTLMEPLVEMPPLDPPQVVRPPARPTPMPSPPALQHPPYPQMMAGEAPQMQPLYPAPLSFQVSQTHAPSSLHGSGAQPVYPLAQAPEPRLFEDLGASQSHNAIDPTTQLAIKKRRLIVIAVSAIAVVVIGIVIAMASGGGGKNPDPVETKLPSTEHDVATTPSPTPTDVPVAMVADAALPVVQVPQDAAAAEPPKNGGGDCDVAVVTVPKDVEIAIDNTTKIGTAPGTVQLPCGVEVKLFFRKVGFAGQIKTIKPTADMKPLRLALARNQLVVKVSSTPANAAISVGGKAMGFTPTTVKLNGFEPAVITISKEGYASAEQKLTPTKQNQVVHVKLVAKKKTR